MKRGWAATSQHSAGRTGWDSSSLLGGGGETQAAFAGAFFDAVLSSQPG